MGYHINYSVLFLAIQLNDEAFDLHLLGLHVQFDNGRHHTGPSTLRQFAQSGGEPFDAQSLRLPVQLDDDGIHIDLLSYIFHVADDPSKSVRIYHQRQDK